MQAGVTATLVCFVLAMSSSSDCRVSSVISRSLLISAVFLLTLESIFRSPSSSVRHAMMLMKLTAQGLQLRTPWRLQGAGMARVQVHVQLRQSQDYDVWTCAEPAG